MHGKMSFVKLIKMKLKPTSDEFTFYKITSAKFRVYIKIFQSDTNWC